MARSALTHLPALVVGTVFLLILAVLTPLASAQAPTIYTGSDKYKYQGCFNETTQIPGTAHDRALTNGASKVMAGNMTVPLCLSFCNSGTDTEYKYAGVEYSRECWCSQHISGLSTKLDDAQCNLTCDGNKDQVCGGALKLSVYMNENGSSRVAAAAWGLLVAGVVTAYMV